MSQTDNTTIEDIFNELRECGLDANTEFCALLLKHFGEHRLMAKVHKESLDRAVFYFHKYKETEKQLKEALKQLEAKSEKS